MEPAELPGSRHCVGCGGLTFRNRDDRLCPRCAFEAEHLIEQIELESLDNDLALMTRFEAYCRQRDLAGNAPARARVFGSSSSSMSGTQREVRPFDSGGSFTHPRSA